MTIFQSRFLKLVLVSAAVLLFGMMSARDVQAASPKKETDVDRMTDLLVVMMPFGQIFEMAAKQDPNWPLQQKPGVLKPQELSCLRSELSADGFRRMKINDVKAYAETNKSRMTSDVQLLDQGASFLFGKLMMAGVESERTGVQVDPTDILKEATPDQMASFITFFNDPNYAELRKLSGLGDALGMGKSAKENESAGEQLGASLAIQVMLKAMTTCDVPTSVLF